MYLSEIKLWNFRKYGIKGENAEKPEPGLILCLQPGLNVLIGENDSGKSAIIDAVRYTLGTQSGEWNRIEDTDFHGQGDSRANNFKIECIFRGFSHAEAGQFMEWLGFEEVAGQKEYVLNLRLTAQRKTDRIINDLRAGPDEIGTLIDGDARAKLRVTYLKPLRDAENELTAGKRSRFAQILRAHPHFQKTIVDGIEKPHKLEEIIHRANKEIKKHFHPEKQELPEDDNIIVAEKDARALLVGINNCLKDFFRQGDSRSAKVAIAGSDLSDILRRLELSLEENPAGLGSLNLLYMAAELLLLQDANFLGLRLAIIEELEAHLHPQAQLRLINFLTNNGVAEQYILTTHSTTLGSSVDLKKLIICRDSNVFPLAPKFTKLEPRNYDFLQRFLDSTKANLFFARGVILVEGDAENLLIPTIAEIIGRPLHKYGVSIVNIGSTAFSHYEKIFERTGGESIGVRVAVITDLDVKPLEWYKENDNSPTMEEIENNKLEQYNVRNITYADNNIKRFVSPNWTLEYELALSPLRGTFYESVLLAEKKQNSKTGDPSPTKEQEVIDNAKKNLESWKSSWNNDDRHYEKVAFEIYKKTLLDKEISKAIVSQEFAARLLSMWKLNQDGIRNRLLRPPSLKYLVDAICHVTEPLK